MKTRRSLFSDSLLFADFALVGMTCVQLCLYKHVDKNIINPKSACTIIMLAQNYHTEALERL